MNDIAAEIIDILRDRELTLGTVESATGGLIAHLITNIPGSSDVFRGSIVSYSNDIKMKIVGVKTATLAQCGAVSSQVASEMAAGGRKALGVDICVADTGIAGPGGATPGKPVGLFYLGLSKKDGTETQKHLFTGSRDENKQQAAQTALRWVLDYLKKSPPTRK
jgi:nicotinamide-nucleotide amidase